MIEAEEAMRALGAASKMNAELDFLPHLRDFGRATAESWLKANWDALSNRSSVDLRATSFS